MRTERDEQRCILIIQACCVLHNLLIATWKDFVTSEELNDILGDDFSYRKWDRVQDDYYEFEEDHRRRELLVDEMREIDPEEDS